MFLAFVPLLVAGSAAASSGGTAAPAAAPAQVEKRICKRMGTSESRMGSKRICKTAAEWKRMDRNDERVTVKSDRSGRSD